jgi:hypothetical protein
MSNRKVTVESSRSTGLDPFIAWLLCHQEKLWWLHSLYALALGVGFMWLGKRNFAFLRVACLRNRRRARRRLSTLDELRVTERPAEHDIPARSRNRGRAIDRPGGTQSGRIERAKKPKTHLPAHEQTCILPVACNVVRLH